MSHPANKQTEVLIHEQYSFHGLLHRESKKTRHQTLGHNFTNYYPIFNFFSLPDAVVNLQQTRV